MEESALDGERPILLPDVTPIELGTLLGQGSQAQEFGANQVIIVRDQDAKTNASILFPSALCMTVPETKGLEFDDAFLFNFFTSSEAEGTIFLASVPIHPPHRDTISVPQRLLENFL